MKTLNKKTKFKFKNSINFNEKEHLDFAFKQGIELEKAINFSKIILKVNFKTEFITEGFQVVCFKEIADFKKEFLKYESYFYFYIDGISISDKAKKLLNFEIDLSEHFDNITDEYKIERIAIIPKEIDVEFECSIFEK